MGRLNGATPGQRYVLYGTHPDRRTDVVCIITVITSQPRSGSCDEYGEGLIFKNGAL